MTTMVDALALVPSKVPDDEEDQTGDTVVADQYHDVPLDKFMEDVMVPPQEDHPFYVWTFEGMVDHFTKKADIEDDLMEITKGAMDEMDIEEKIAIDAATEHNKGSHLLRRIAIWGIKRVVKFVMRLIWKGVFKLVKWFIKKIVTWTVEGLLEGVVEPVLMTVLEFVGVNPELWPLVAALGGIAAFGALTWAAITGKDKGTSMGAPAANEDEEEDLLEKNELEAAVTTTVGPRDLGPSGAAFPSAAGAPVAAGPMDESLAGTIARGEGNYRSINLGKAHGYRAGTADLESMTLGEVMQHQAAHDFNAVGRYQIIGDTLAGAVKYLHLSPDLKFDKELQDHIFNDYLITVKRPQIGNYITGRSNNLNAAVLAASQEWASVAAPVNAPLAKGGRGDGFTSYYAGTANNRASTTADQMAAALQNARAQNLGPASTAVDSTTVKNGPGVATAKPGAANGSTSTSQSNAGANAVDSTGDKQVIVGKRGELIGVNT